MSSRFRVTRGIPGLRASGDVTGFRTSKDLENMDINFILLRYSDILLMYAEAVNALDGQLDQLALECLNQVKRRAYGYDPTVANSEIDLKASDFASSEDVTEYLMVERVRELCFEGFRRFDLIRWNKLAEVLDDFALKFNNAVKEGILSNYVWAAGNYFRLENMSCIRFRNMRSVKQEEP